MKLKYQMLMVVVGTALLVGCTDKQKEADREVRALCEKDGGVKVYETVKLLPNEIGPDGKLSPHIADMTSNTGGRFRLVMESFTLKQGNPSIEKHTAKIVMNENSKPISEYISFTRRGGDNFFFGLIAHPSVFVCSDVSSKYSFEELKIQTFNIKE